MIHPGGSSKAVFLMIFLVAVIVRIPLLPSAEEPAYGEAVWVARTLAATGEFANPFGTPTGPTAHVAPVYPALLAVFLKLFDYGPSFHMAIILFALVCSATTWALLPWTAQRLGLPFRIGVAAGVLGALYPFRKEADLNGAWEAPLVAMILAILVPLIWTADWTDRRKLLSLALAAGLLVLAYPVAFGTWLGLLVVRLWSRSIDIRKASLALAISLAVLVPWTVRNWMALGGLCFVRCNLGLELWISNRESAKPTLAENLQFGIPVKTVPHPDVNLAEALKMRQMGEFSYNRMRLRDALSRIRTHPGEFARLTLRRAGYFAAPLRRNGLFRFIEAAVSAGALAGVVLMLNQRVQAALPVLILWLTIAPIYTVVQSDERYRYPVEWSIFLSLAFALTELAGRVRRMRDARLSIQAGCSGS